MSPRSDPNIEDLFGRLEKLVSELKEAYRRLEEQALRDELTGLYNRRALDQRLDEEIHRAARHGQSLSLLFVDIDDFKSHNDTLGHGIGDRVLEEMGRILMANGRAMDLFFRYGGEEFVALLPQTGTADAVKVGERIREGVARHAFADGMAELTVSVGVAAYPEHGRDGPSLLEAADRAQYNAKRRGKNRVYVASDDPVEASKAAGEAPPTKGETRVAVGFGGGASRPNAVWLDGEMQPVLTIKETKAHIPGVQRHYVITTPRGRYELYFKNKEWYVKPAE